MPIREYVCGACHRRVERLEFAGDKALKRCQYCGAERLSRTISRSTFLLVGGGWSKDGYQKGKK